MRSGSPSHRYQKTYYSANYVTDPHVVIIDDVCKVICGLPIRFDQYRIIESRNRLKRRALVPDQTVDNVLKRRIHCWSFETYHMPLTFSRTGVRVLSKNVEAHTIIVGGQAESTPLQCQAAESVWRTEAAICLVSFEELIGMAFV